MTASVSLDRHTAGGRDDSPGTRPVARLEHIGVSFGDMAVLRDVTMSIEPGSFVSLIGRSGCGKSTLLRVIAGLLAPSTGSLEVTDSQAFGFQDARLVPWMRLWDNVTLGMPGRASERRDLAAHALDQVQLREYVDAWPMSLSGGQAQRASLARALIREPRLLLLDEPFGALDALTRLDMQDLIADLQAEHGWAALMVTHDIAEAVRLSDRILVLHDGRIEEDITPDRSCLNEDGRPIGHDALEHRLRAALR